jgi:16S rRNA (adenine1518-N6/adenine1519-N6)-dimethyltransferase
MGEPEYGRHYLTDQKLVSFIIREARLKPEDVVLDIGAGNGVLTREVVKVCRCIALEVDPSCKKNLEATGAQVIIGNALDNIDALTFNKVVSNIPYAISEPLFYRLSKRKFELGILMIGENFLTVLEQKTKAGLFFKSAYTVRLLKDVPGAAFTPPPRVESCVIKATPKAKTAEDEVIQRLLFLDDKKLKNAMLKVYEGKRTKKEVRAVATASFYSKSIVGISNEDVKELVKDITTINQSKNY